MEEILDQEFNENEKDETQINRGVAIIRVVVCFGCLYFLYMMLTTELPDVNNWADLTFMIGLPLMLILIIIFNSFRIIQELKQRFIIPIQKKIFTLIIIIVQSIMTIMFASVCFSAVRLRFRKGYIPIDWHEIIILLLTLGLSTIIVREITYYKRATRLKRLKNE